MHNPQDETNKLILALLLTMGILVVSSFLLPSPPMTPPPSEEARQTPQVSEELAPTRPAVQLSAEDVLKRAPRVRIQTPRLEGSINLQGARVDDLVLLDYHQTVEGDNPVRLLSPANTTNPFFGEVGWLAANGENSVPTRKTVWQASNGALTPTSPVTLSWDNGLGLTFKIRYEIDENYVLTATQSVENTSGREVILYPYARLREGNVAPGADRLVHEGPIGYAGGELRDPEFSDLEDGKAITYQSTGGWFGMTRPYWAAAFIPDQSAEVRSQFRLDSKITGNAYQMDYTLPPQMVSSGSTSSTRTRLFAGPKVLDMLQDYESEFDVTHFDMLVDFGWFYFLTKPFLSALTWLYDLVGNLGIGILILTVMIKLVLFPLTYKSVRAMNRMKDLQPRMKEIKEKYKDDTQRFQKEMMALYKKEKVNPAAGCLPILLQIPVFFSIYKVLNVSIEMRHAPFYGWINDLSAPDPTSILNLFGALPWGAPETGILSLISVGIWPIIMGLTMYVQMQMNPTPPDAMQAKMMKVLPLIFTFVLAHFPAGLVIYWSWNNFLSIFQQAGIRHLNRKHTAKEEAKKSTKKEVAPPPNKKSKKGKRKS